MNDEEIRFWGHYRSVESAARAEMASGGGVPQQAIAALQDCVNDVTRLARLAAANCGIKVSDGDSLRHILYSLAEREKVSLNLLEDFLDVLTVLEGSKRDSALPLEISLIRTLEVVEAMWVQLRIAAGNT